MGLGEIALPVHDLPENMSGTHHGELSAARCRYVPFREMAEMFVGGGVFGDGNIDAVMIAGPKTEGLIIVDHRSRFPPGEFHGLLLLG